MQSGVVEIASMLEFWPKLSEEERAHYLRNTTLMRYRAGQNIHGNAEECLGVLLVRSGGLRTYLLSEEGREVTLYRLFPGDVCVLAASCILENIDFEVHIDAEADSEVFLTSPAAYAVLQRQNLYVENFTYKVAADRFSDVMWAMQQILFMSFDRRLATFLIDELVRNGGDTVYLTHEQIARYLGSAREVVSRMVKYFALEGLVEPLRGGIRVLDRAGLLALT
ncbi:MAG: Crp/Fnr family transcriptional regulator [Clostridiales bacterium]|nr:Crp/Fnr family transcriptional regulator [Clostridiales bacterium]